jgi:pyridoxamine 5'-phosphate oxidase
VRISGPVSAVSREESEIYFRSRPRTSRLSTWISHQSQVIPGRSTLEQRQREMQAQFPDDVPLPPSWGGYRVTPASIEFWQGRESRLHDRLRYSREQNGAWRLERLAP